MGGVHEQTQKLIFFDVDSVLERGCDGGTSRVLEGELGGVVVGGGRDGVGLPVAGDGHPIDEGVGDGVVGETNKLAGGELEGGGVGCGGSLSYREKEEESNLLSDVFLMLW